MAQIAFDTLEYSNRLQAGGIPMEQAEAIAAVNAYASKNLVEMQELVTKKDLAITLAEIKSVLEAQIAGNRSALEARISDSKTPLEAKLADAKHELRKWLIGPHAAQVALMPAIAGIVVAVLK